MIALLFTALVAASQPAFPPPAVAGITAYNLGDFRTAERDLAEAYAESGDIQWLYAFAQAARMARDHLRALAGYRAFLAACDALVESGDGTCGATAVANAERWSRP